MADPNGDAPADDDRSARQAENNDEVDRICSIADHQHVFDSNPEDDDRDSAGLFTLE